jgi:hypothetical protein
MMNAWRQQHESHDLMISENNNDDCMLCPGTRTLGALDSVAMAMVIGDQAEWGMGRIRSARDLSV